MTSTFFENLKRDILGEEQKNALTMDDVHLETTLQHIGLDQDLHLLEGIYQGSSIT